jgi:pimeloyl-ACP methyl ester carboxylesterase
LGGNYNQYHASAHQQQFAERGRGHVVLSPSGRGPDGWYVDYAGADTFEAWADVREHYALNPTFTSISGYSMGGHGSFRFATQFPDLFARAQTVVGPPAVGVWVPPLTNPGPASNTFEALESLYHVPVQSWVASADQLVPYPGPRAQADRLFELGYRSEFWTFAPAEHLTLAAHDQYLPAAEFLGDAQVVTRPRTVVFQRNPGMDFPAAGIVADHAYWLSNIQLRDAALQTGLVRAQSLALPASLGPDAASSSTTAGLLQPGTLGAIGYLAESLRWEGEPTDTDQRNVLRVTLQNIAEVTVDMQAAGLSCRAQIEVNSDGPARVIRGGC